MKFTVIFVSALAACTSLLSVAAAPVHLEKRSPLLPALLHGPTTFYRAVTRGELAHIGSYQKGHHPKYSYVGVSDFAHDGGLYVFSDLGETIRWGDAYASTAPDPKQQHCFATGTEEWKQFVISNYGEKKPATHYDLIEGPLSVGTGNNKSPALTDGNMVYQAAFVGDQALGTLIVEDVVQRYPKGKSSWIPGCVIL